LPAQLASLRRCCWVRI